MPNVANENRVVLEVYDTADGVFIVVRLGLKLEGVEFRMCQRVDGKKAVLPVLRRNLIEGGVHGGRVDGDLQQMSRLYAESESGCPYVANRSGLTPVVASQRKLCLFSK